MTESNELDAAEKGEMEWYGLSDNTEEIARLKSNNESLRHIIEARIMDDKDWQREYNEFLDSLKEVDSGE